MIIATLITNLGLDASNYTQGLNKAENDGRGFGARVGGFLNNAFAFATGGLISKGIEGIVGSFDSLKSGMIDGNAEFETYTTQFGVLLGNADAAKQRLEDLAKFGATTPFELPEVVRADKILQSFGLHAEDSAKRFGFAGEDIRTIAGDTASGAGASFEEISGYIGKFASGATGETIARFQELGIVTKQQLTDMGLSFDKGGSLIINSQEELDRATGILLTSMKSKYGGMMDAQSATFQGMISNAQDWVSGTLRTIGSPIFDVLKVSLGNVLTWLPTIQPQIDGFATGLATGIGTAVDWISEKLPTLITWFTGLQATLSAGWTAIQPWIAGFQWLFAVALDIIGVLGDQGLGAAFNRLQGYITAASGYFGPLIESALGPLRDSFIAALPGMLTGLEKLIGNVGSWVVERLPEVAAMFLSWGGALIAWVQPYIPPLLTELGKLLGKGWAWIQEQAPGWLQNLMKWGQELVDWVAPFIPPLLTELGKLVGKAWQAIVDAAPGLVENLGTWTTGFLTWIGKEAPGWGKALGKMAGDAIVSMFSDDTEIDKGLGGWLTKFTDWVVKDAAPGFTKALIGIAEGLGSGLLELGGIVGPKLWEGITNTAEKLKDYVVTASSDLAKDLGESLYELGKVVGPRLWEGVLWAAFNMNWSTLNLAVGQAILNAVTNQTNPTGSSGFGGTSGASTWGTPTIPAAVQSNQVAPSVNVTVQGSVVSERELSQVVRNTLIDYKRSNLGIGLA